MRMPAHLAMPSPIAELSNSLDLSSFDSKRRFAKRLFGIFKGCGFSESMKHAHMSKSDFTKVIFVFRTRSRGVELSTLQNKVSNCVLDLKKYYAGQVLVGGVNDLAFSYGRSIQIEWSFSKSQEFEGPFR